MKQKDFDGIPSVDISASVIGDDRMIEVAAGYGGGSAHLSAEEARAVARDLLAAADWLDGKLTYRTTDAFPERLPGKPA